MVRFRPSVLLVATLLTASLVPRSPAQAELTEAFQRWNEPVEPFRIAGDLYYVGTNELAAFLFVTSEGHILVDGGFEETAPLIRDSVEALGFALDEVRILLNSHAHSDHAGGLAKLSRWTGARLIASRADSRILEAGGEEPYPFPPVSPNRLIGDGETVELGGTVLTARITAGHTPGCTTWTTTIEIDGEDRAVVFICSVNALPEMDLLSPDPAFPEGRVSAFERSFELLDKLPCEVLLGSHASFFLMSSKREEIGRSDRNPFVDPELCRRHIAAKRKRFEDELAQQRSAEATLR